MPVPWYPSPPFVAARAAHVAEPSETQIRALSEYALLGPNWTSAAGGNPSVEWTSQKVAGYTSKSTSVSPGTGRFSHVLGGMGSVCRGPGLVALEPARDARPPGGAGRG